MRTLSAPIYMLILFHYLVFAFTRLHGWFLFWFVLAWLVAGAVLVAYVVRTWPKTTAQPRQQIVPRFTTNGDYVGDVIVKFKR